MALALERVPQHRAQRVLVFDDENLGGSGHAGGASAEPARRHAGFARFFFDVGDLLLGSLESALTLSISWIAWSRSPASFIFW